MICLPGAGTPASAFRTWTGSLPAGVELLAAQLPGREDRLFEPPHGTLEAVVDELAGVLDPLLPAPLLILGHSFGALVGFALTQRLEASAPPGTLHLCVAALAAPGAPRRHPQLATLDQRALLGELVRLGGIAPELLRYQELLDLCLPAVQADLELLARHWERPHTPVRTPITALGATADPLVDDADLDGWSSLTLGSFSRATLVGEHFAVLENPREASRLAIGAARGEGWCG